MTHIKRHTSRTHMGDPAWTQMHTHLDSGAEHKIPTPDASMFGRHGLDLIHSSLLAFLDGEAPHSLDALQHLETFLSFSEVSLLIGHVYLRRHAAHAAVDRGDCGLFVKLYLVCCMLATKYIDDTRISNDAAASRWRLCTSEINSLEIDILMSLGFDLHVSDEVLRILNRSRRRDPETTYTCIVEIM